MSARTDDVAIGHAADSRNGPETDENSAWNGMFQRLLKYKQRHGHCLVPKSYERDPELSMWIQNQRTCSVTQEHVEKLDSIGFAWSAHDQDHHSWKRMLKALKKYKRENGNCLVPRSHPQLGPWVARVRTDKAENRLDPDCKRILDDLGFVWRLIDNDATPPSESWDSMYARLQEYKQVHGNCAVSQHYDDDPKLADWVDKQRNLKNNDRLRKERKQKLDEIGFPWSVTHDTWDAMFSLLEEYKKNHGDCLVPLTFPQYPRLGRWVKEQRKKKDYMLESRKERLDSLGFVWSVPTAKWEKMFEALMEYKRETGNCNVPKRYPRNPPLGRWVHNQRLRRHATPLDRLKRLDAVGFFDATWANRRKRALSEAEASNSSPPNSKQADVDDHEEDGIPQEVQVPTQVAIGNRSRSVPSPRRARTARRRVPDAAVSSSCTAPPSILPRLEPSDNNVTATDRQPPRALQPLAHYHALGPGPELMYRRGYAVPREEYSSPLSPARRATTALPPISYNDLVLPTVSSSLALSQPSTMVVSLPTVSTLSPTQIMAMNGYQRRQIENLLHMQNLRRMHYNMGPPQLFPLRNDNENNL